METRFYRGTLTRWDDKKGFGFIESEKTKEHIFLHISALKHMSRRPLIGDTIEYQLHTDNSGKRRAVNASIEGVASISPKYHRMRRGRKKGNRGLSKLAAAVFLCVVGAVIYTRFAEQSGFVDRLFSDRTPVVNRTSTDVEIAAPAFSCGGKVYCSEMTSCEEATFYIHNCPNTKMDGDNDGIPCEGQWCR